MEPFTPSEGAIFIKTGSSIDKVNISDIYAIESEGNYCTVKTADKEYIQRSSLVRMKEKLKSLDFIQVNKSTILPISGISNIDLAENTIYIEGQSYALSRNFRKDFIDALNLI